MQERVYISINLGDTDTEYEARRIISLTRQNADRLCPSLYLSAIMYTDMYPYLGTKRFVCNRCVGWTPHREHAQDSFLMTRVVCMLYRQTRQEREGKELHWAMGRILLF